MQKQPRSVLVLSNPADPELAMLADLPHAVVGSLEALAASGNDAEVIFHWVAPRDLLRAAFLANPGVRWVHSRAAGLDNILFPELIESAVPLTNGTGVFSPSLGEFALAAILYFAKDFRRMLRNQEAGRWEQFEVEEIAGQTVGIVAYGDIGRAVCQPRPCHGDACSGAEAPCSRISRSADCSVLRTTRAAIRCLLFATM